MCVVVQGGGVCANFVQGNGAKRNQAVRVTSNRLITNDLIGGPTRA